MHRGNRGELLEAMRAAAEAVDLDELGGDALDHLRRAAGASNVLLYRYDAHGAPHGVSGSLAPAVHSYGRELFEEDPVQHHLLGLPPDNDVILTIHELDRATYHRS